MGDYIWGKAPREAFSNTIFSVLDCRQLLFNKLFCKVYHKRSLFKKLRQVLKFKVPCATHRRLQFRPVKYTVKPYVTESKNQTKGFWLGR